MEELNIFTSEGQEISIKKVFLEFHDKNNFKNYMYYLESEFSIVAIIHENVMTDICNHMESKSNAYDMNMLIKIPCYEYLNNREVKAIVVPSENTSGVTVDRISFSNAGDKNLAYYESELKKVNAQIEDYPSEEIRRYASVIVKQVDQYIRSNLKNHMRNQINPWEVTKIVEDLYYGINSKHIYDETSNHGNLFEIDISDYELKKVWSKKEQLINMHEINGIINRYVRLSWLHSPLLENYILQAYVYHCLMVQKRDFIRYDFVNAISAAAQTESQYYMRLCLLNIVSIFLAYVLPGCFLFWSISSESIIGSILSAIYVVWQIISRKSQQNEKKLILEIFSSLFHIRDFISARTWSPSALLDRISKVGDKINIPELFPLVNKINSRDPNSFCI